MAEQEITIEDRYRAQIKDFANSEAFTEYLLPMLMKPVQAELPSPTEKNWEDRYRYAYALSAATSMVVNCIRNIASQDEYMKKVKEYAERTAIDEA